MSSKKQNKKDRRFHAEEVCYSLSIAADLGFTHKEMVEFAWPSLLEWADLVKWREDREQEKQETG